MGRVSGAVWEKLRAAGERIADAWLYLCDDVVDGVRSARARGAELLQVAREELAPLRAAAGERLRRLRLPALRPRGPLPARIAALTALLAVAGLSGGVLLSATGADGPARLAEGDAAARPPAPKPSGSQPVEVARGDSGALADVLAPGGPRPRDVPPPPPERHGRATGDVADKRTGAGRQARRRRAARSPSPRNRRPQGVPVERRTRSRIERPSRRRPPSRGDRLYAEGPAAPVATPAPEPSQPPAPAGGSPPPPQPRPQPQGRGPDRDAWDGDDDRGRWDDEERGGRDWGDSSDSSDSSDSDDD